MPQCAISNAPMRRFEISFATGERKYSCEIYLSYIYYSLVYVILAKG